MIDQEIKNIPPFTLRSAIVRLTVQPSVNDREVMYLNQDSEIMAVDTTTLPAHRRYLYIRAHRGKQVLIDSDLFIVDPPIVVGDIS